MSEIQAAKDLVRAYYAALDGAEVAEIPEVIGRFATPSYEWLGYHPFDALTGAAEVGRTFWQPLRRSLGRIQRRLDVFMAGHNRLPGTQGVWVCSMGHLMGLFDAPWLGIAPTGRMAFLRYGEFHLIEDGKIARTAMYFDIPHLMMQSGLAPFPPQTAAHLVQPGPQTHDGVMFGPQAPQDGDRTQAAIDAMIGDLGQWASGLPLEEELARSWHDDMIWWGPAGIGATYTIERYAKQHAGPFRAGFRDRSATGHICRIAEGAYGGFFGWPNFTAVPTGGFMSMPATDRPGEFRVIDIYRRAGDKLAENWVFIDLLHFWKQQGVDVLARMQAVSAAGKARSEP
ncbi:nuclear transport factor 2 family protein [Sulfitobacter sabulilitoris]|uniref:Ester cyclase n=1 Tax=Sulfitobacter sabulilitoris TaxID=2562655 RepID=A0A5S3P7T1_9RHOB|nr:nuclear transport factor 2 family protein [Sulfitobacter sabulilitoris]TMM49462.1 ester cyclase [Sulfitobacter sabulilitoris]